MCTLR